MQNFEQVFKRYWTYVCTIVYKHTGEDGEDIASKVFTQLSANYNHNNFENEFALKSWLSLTTTRMCIDYKRKRTRDKASMQNYTAEVLATNEVAQQATDADRQEIEDYVIRFIYNEIKSLPPKTRRVFELHYFKDMNYRDIAKQLGISKTTVVAQMQNARNLLRLNILFDKKAAPIMARRMFFKQER